MSLVFGFRLFEEDVMSNNNFTKRADNLVAIAYTVSGARESEWRRVNVCRNVALSVAGLLSSLLLRLKSSSRQLVGTEIIRIRTMITL